MTVTIENLYTGNGSTTDYSFTFPYLDTTDIKVSLATVATTAYSLLNATTVRFTSAPGNGVAIRIYRETAFDTPKATFYPGSAIRANDLNDNTLQNLYVNQESNDKVADAWLSGDPTVISTETWYTTDDTKVATTKAIEGRIDAKIDTALTTDVAAGNKITVTDNSPGSGQITVGVTSGSLVNSDVNASAAIAGTKIAPNFGSQNVSTSGTLASGAATVTGNIAVSGTVDGRDVAADGTKLDGIESAATADQTNAEIRTAVEAASDSNVFTDADHTKLNAVEDNATRDQTNAEIRTLVESATDSNVFTDADHSKLNAIEASATADQTDAEIRAAVEAATDSNVFTDADHTKLNAIEASATADQTASEIKSLIASSPLDDSHLAANSVGDSEIATGALDNRYYTETELNAGQLDNRYYTESESDARYFNISTGDTIKDGDAFPDNDTTIATTAAINDRIIDLVDDVGGFVPIANETSFPNANPDVNNGTGTLVSIKALSSNLTSNGSGVATISNGTVGNSTVTINGLANSTTYAANFGMIVETTTTLNTYTFHRQVPIATEVSTVAGSISNVNTVAGSISNVNTVAGNNSNVTTVAGANSNITSVAGSISNVNTVATNISNVNDFSDKYRVASSAPTSSLDTGDLYFDTSANELKVYNGSAWQGGVTATGNLAGLGANTFTGNQSLGDNLKVQFGDSQDLQIYHDGSHSYIKDTGTGLLRIVTDGLKITNAAESENILQATENGAVELYYDNSKKLSTVSTGIQFEDNTHMNNNKRMRMGSGDIFQLYSDGTNNHILSDTGELRIRSNNLRLVNDDGTEKYLTGVENGAVELYYDNVKKAETTADGLQINGVTVSTGNIQINNDTGKIRLGASQDLQIYHDGTNNHILADNGELINRAQVWKVTNEANSENMILAGQNGAVSLFYDNSKKFETTAGGVVITGSIDANDTISSGNANIKIDGDTGKFFAGASNDLQIYHNGTNSYIDNNTNNIYIRNNVDGDDGGNIYIEAKSGETSIECADDSFVALYYDGSKKLETGSHGVIISGNTYQADNYVAAFGSADDLQIYHNGAHSLVQNNTGTLHMASQTLKLTNTNVGHTYLEANVSNSVDLYYDNSKKFETTSGGINVTGAINVNGSALSSGLWTEIHNDHHTQSTQDSGSNFGRHTITGLGAYDALRIRIIVKTTDSSYPGDGGSNDPNYGRFAMLFGTSSGLDTGNNYKYGHHSSSWDNQDAIQFDSANISGFTHLVSAFDLEIHNFKSTTEHTFGWGIQAYGENGVYARPRGLGHTGVNHAWDRIALDWLMYGTPTVYNYQLIIEGTIYKT